MSMGAAVKSVDYAALQFAPYTLNTLCKFAKMRFG